MSPTVESFRSSWRGSAAILVDCHLTITASSSLAEALFPALRPGDNLARRVFLGPGPGSECGGDASAQVVAMLHASIGKNDEVLRPIVGELAALSRGFSAAWAHDVERPSPTGTVRWRHPSVGPMALRYELVGVAGSDDMVIVWRGGDPAAVGALESLASRV